MQTQILPQARETTKKSEIRKFKMADGRGIKITLLAITQLHAWAAPPVRQARQLPYHF